MALSDAQLAEFHDRGYVVVRGLVDPDTIARLQQEVDQLHERMAAATPERVGVSWEELPEGRPPRIRQLMNSERVSPIIDAVLASDAMLDVVEQIVGPDIVLFHSKLMMKAARDGTFTPWHQDWGYWQHGSAEPTQLNGMLAIDPATIENGCIRFVPGSHKDGPVDHQRFASSSFNIGLEGDIDAYDNQPVELEPGDVVFFGPLVIHGSAPNRSDHDRRANTFAFDKPGNGRHEGVEHRVLRGAYSAASASSSAS